MIELIEGNFKLIGSPPLLKFQNSFESLSSVKGTRIIIIESVEDKQGSLETAAVS
jgi:hypothetical protein